MNTYETESGRKPPPVAQRFKRGQSGNLCGRPKGAISKKLLTKKVALTRIPRNVNGKKQYLTVLEAVTLTVRTMAMEGTALCLSICAHDSSGVSVSGTSRNPPPPSGAGGCICAMTPSISRLRDDHRRN
jgi:hypothetical protein